MAEDKNVNPNGNNGADDVVTFNEKQQEKVNQLIRQKQGEAAAEVKQQLAETKTVLDALKAELDEAKQALASAKTTDGKKSAKDDVEQLQLKIEEMKTANQNSLKEIERLTNINRDASSKINDAKAEAINIRKEAAITKAATACGFIDPSEVADLTARNIKFDESKGRFVVIGDNGQERLNSAFEEMTLEEFYQEYATKKPHLVRADARGGVGSSESQKSGLNGAGSYKLEQIFGPKSDSKIANKLALENKKEYTRLREQAKAAGLIA